MLRIIEVYQFADWLGELEFQNAVFTKPGRKVNTIHISEQNCTSFSR